jgi:hypothetical protein
MCAFRKTFEALKEFPGNTRQLCGQCGQITVAGRKNLPPAAPIAGVGGSGLARKTHVLLGFSRWHGAC